MYVRQTNWNIIHQFRLELLWISSIQLIKTLVYYILSIIVFNALIMLCIFPYIILINNFRSNVPPSSFPKSTSPIFLNTIYFLATLLYFRLSKFILSMLHTREIQQAPELIIFLLSVICSTYSRFGGL